MKCTQVGIDTTFGLRPVFAQLEADGYVEKVHVDNDGETCWDTTIKGNALQQG